VWTHPERREGTRRHEEYEEGDCGQSHVHLGTKATKNLEVREHIDVRHSGKLQQAHLAAVVPIHDGLFGREAHARAEGAAEGAASDNTRA